MFFEQLQSKKSEEFMCCEENVCVCADCCFDPLCSPPSVSSGSADPPASPRSEGAWSPGSPSSVTPPSQLLWKYMDMFWQGYFDFRVNCPFSWVRIYYRSRFLGSLLHSTKISIATNLHMSWVFTLINVKRLLMQPAVLLLSWKFVTVVCCVQRSQKYFLSKMLL